MIAIISPAKTLDFDGKVPFDEGYGTAFAKAAIYRPGKLGKHKPSEIGLIVGISQKGTSEFLETDKFIFFHHVEIFQQVRQKF